MRAYKGLVKDGQIVLAEAVDLPEGAVVTVTIGEAEYIKASIRSALLRTQRRKNKLRIATPVLTTVLPDGM